MEASCKPERRRRLPYIMSDAREAKIATSHYDSSTAQRTSVTEIRAGDMVVRYNRGLFPQES